MWHRVTQGDTGDSPLLCSSGLLSFKVRQDRETLTRRMRRSVPRGSRRSFVCCLRNVTPHTFKPLGLMSHAAILASKPFIWKRGNIKHARIFSPNFYFGPSFSTKWKTCCLWVIPVCVTQPVCCLPKVCLRSPACRRTRAACLGAHGLSHHAPLSQWPVYADQWQREAEERQQAGSARRLSVSLGLVSALYEKRQILRLFFNPGPCHLPKECSSLLDNWASHSLWCHKTRGHTALLVTAEDCCCRMCCIIFSASYFSNHLVVCVSDQKKPPKLDTSLLKLIGLSYSRG